ncbi:MAG: ankyrin repeat domain-containing protein [Pseudomonadota bacterium]
MPTKRLPPRADLSHLKHQAKDLLKGQRSGAPIDLQRIREFHPEMKGLADDVIQIETFTLGDAQLTIAREYGYVSWRRLRAVISGSLAPDLDLPHHERIEHSQFRRAVDLIDAGEAVELARHLASHPDLVSMRVSFEGGNYFQCPPLIAFIAENPIRYGALPPNIIEITGVLLEAGAGQDQAALNETLGLVCSGRIARESGCQDTLIELLCKAGAEPDWAMFPALGHGEFKAVEVLLSSGATLDLAVAAATGRVQVATERLASATPLDRHRALAFSALHGHVDVVSLLLANGEDPDRYNPEGCHAHSTPMHQAALAGWLDVVQVLVDAGARLDVPDVHHRATPLEWAEHAKQDSVVAFLTPRQARSSGD